MMTYEEAVRGLNGRGMFLGINSYEHTEELLRLLGEPQRSAGEILHIAGTNGKGSVTAFLESVLRAAGNTTGRFIGSPLCCYRGAAGMKISAEAERPAPEQGTFGSSLPGDKSGVSEEGGMTL